MKIENSSKKIVYELVPLSGGFMLTGLLGFIVVSIYTFYGRIPLPLGFALDLAFIIMFIASVISITPIFPSELNKKTN